MSPVEGPPLTPYQRAAPAPRLWPKQASINPHMDCKQANSHADMSLNFSRDPHTIKQKVWLHFSEYIHLHTVRILKIARNLTPPLTKRVHGWRKVGNYQTFVQGGLLSLNFTRFLLTTFFPQNLLLLSLCMASSRHASYNSPMRKLILAHHASSL